MCRYINFFKLDKMVEGAAPAGGLGGTKGGVLGETVRDIYFTFKRAAETLKVKGYDLLDIGARSFDQDYADFKLVRVGETYETKEGKEEEKKNGHTSTSGSWM